MDLFMRLLLAALSPLFLSACVGSFPADVSPNPSPDDPDSGIVLVRSADYFDGYADRRPVEPTPWRQRNDSVAPGGSQ
jgi:hypothetical protein